MNTGPDISQAGRSTQGVHYNRFLVGKKKETYKEIAYVEIFFFNNKLTLVSVSDSHSTRVNFVSQRVLSKAWRHFDLLNLSGGEGATVT